MNLDMASASHFIIYHVYWLPEENYLTKLKFNLELRYGTCSKKY